MGNKLIIEEEQIREATPEEIAVLFCNLNSDGMARFFSEVSRITSKWKGAGFGFQLSYVISDEHLTVEGLELMREIGEYATPESI